MTSYETLASSYEKLRKAMIRLFAETWPSIRNHSAERRPQPGAGSFHRVRDLENIDLPLGWDTPVTAVDRLHRGRVG